MSGGTARTTRPYDLLTLDPGQFEDLVYDLALRLPVDWETLDPVGRAGSDRGRDVHGLERVRSRARVRPPDREWRFQGKRYGRITPAQLRTLVREAVPDPAHPPHTLVAAVTARVSDTGFQAFRDEARKLGVRRSDLWSRDTLNAKLRARGNSDLRSFYFGDGPAIDGTVRTPLAIDTNPGRDVPLLGRDELLDQLRATSGDVLLVGPPGSGKSRLAQELPGVRFLNHEAGADTIAESLRRHRPRRVALDDAGFDIDRLRTLLELRRAGYRFAIQTVGVTNPYLRGSILDQAGGRPGWAVMLADLALRGRFEEVLSGRGMIGEVEPYLRRAGATSIEALGLLSIIAVLGNVATDEWLEIDRFLGIGALERQRLLQQAAALGVLEPRPGGALRVGPEAFRLALVAHRFYELLPAVWSIREVLKAWPNRIEIVIGATMSAAENGSTPARLQLDGLAPDLDSLTGAMLATICGSRRARRGTSAR